MLSRLSTEQAGDKIVIVKPWVENLPEASVFVPWQWAS
jgi:hypothetical protein